MVGFLVALQIRIFEIKLTKLPKSALIMVLRRL